MAAAMTAGHPVIAYPVAVLVHIPLAPASALPAAYAPVIAYPVAVQIHAPRAPVLLAMAPAHAAIVADPVAVLVHIPGTANGAPITIQAVEKVACATFSRFS